MKSIINAGMCAAKYPTLMQYEDKKGLVVLFIGESRGIVVNAEGDWDTIGAYSEEWDMGCFIPFDGSVTLSN